MNYKLLKYNNNNNNNNNNINNNNNNESYLRIFYDLWINFIKNGLKNL